MDYCNNHGIKRQFFVARTPQQNGVVERKNRTVQEMARTMIMDSKLTDIFWTQAVHIAVHIQNRVMLRNNTDKTPYKLWKGRLANVKHFKFFGGKCYIKKEDGGMGKFDSRMEKRSTCWLLKYKESIQVLQSNIKQSCGKHQRNN